MATKKISELPPLLTVNDDVEFIINDNGVSKKISGFNVKQGLPNNFTISGLFEHSNTINADYTIQVGNNAIAAGPITIGANVVITVPTGSTFVIA